jgi:diguanylate cyclase (GGDEF)-like protein
MAMMSTSAPPTSGLPESAAAWQLIRDDVFDRILDDAALDQLVAERAKASVEPHADLVRLMLGMSLSEVEARTLFARVVEHRQEMSRALGRAVHVRVAALDLLTTQPANRRNPRESRPIMVAPALLERALEAAGSDSVTGLPRAHLFTNLLEHELRQRRRRVAVVFIDLDGFKHVNDEHGHACGDEVLRTMATAAHSVLRRGDVLARVGGDEFALMLINVSPEEATVAVERLRARFEELTARLATSFSAGIAIAIAKEGAVAEDLIARADRAMYEEKRQRATLRAARR